MVSFPPLYLNACTKHGATLNKYLKERTRVPPIMSPPVLEEAVLLSCKAGSPGFAGVSARGQPEKWAGWKDMCEELYCK